MSDLQETPPKQQALTASRCPACGRPALPARDQCPSCWEPMMRLELTGAGQVETCTVLHRAAAGFEAPYPVAYVALAEGLRAFGPVFGIEPQAVRPGLAVEVVLGGEGQPPYWFRPVEDQ